MQKNKDSQNYWNVQKYNRKQVHWIKKYDDVGVLPVHGGRVG